MIQRCNLTPTLLSSTPVSAGGVQGDMTTNCDNRLEGDMATNRDNKLKEDMMTNCDMPPN